MFPHVVGVVACHGERHDEKVVAAWLGLQSPRRIQSSGGDCCGGLYLGLS